DGHAVVGLDERDVVQDEQAGLADSRDLLDGALGRLHAVAAAAAGPRAAQGAIPRTSAAELDRGARIELADEVLPAMAEEVARRQQVVEMADEHGRRSLRIRHDGAGDAVER